MSIAKGRELEGQGKIDEAVAEYVKAGSAVDAARVLATFGRLVDAADAILRALELELANVAAAKPEQHDMVRQAAMLFEKGGQAERAEKIRSALAKTETMPAPPPTVSAPPPAVPAAPATPSVAPAAPSVPPAMRPPATTNRSALSSASFRRPERPPQTESVTAFRPSSQAMPTVPKDVKRPSSGATPTVQKGEVRPSNPPISTPPKEAPKKEQRLGAGGEVVTDYSGSREAGWREESALASIDAMIEQSLAAGKKGAAARIAWDAGRFAQALPWFVELELHYQAGACLRALGRDEEALATLLKVGPGAQYRKACLEIVPIAAAKRELDIDLDRHLAAFVDEGPREREDVPVFIQLARLYRDGISKEGARRVIAKILAFDPANADAKALRAEMEVKAASSHPPRASAQGLPPLPSLDEFVRLARVHAPKS